MKTKKRFAIVRTWNGNEMLANNSALVEEWLPAQIPALLLRRAKQEIGRIVKMGVLVTIKPRSVTYELNEDHGSVKALRMHRNTYGCVIRCNVNEAVLLNESDYRQQMAAARAEQDPADRSEADNDFFPASGEYDLLFVRL